MFGYGYSMYYMSYIILIPAILLSIYASNKVKSTFAEFSSKRNLAGWTGAEVARRILDMNGLYDVKIQPVRGSMTDHYDPESRTVRLSDTVYGRSSLSAVSVAAHECGHAIQHQENYVFLSLRHAIVPVANFANQLSMPLIMIGILMGAFYSSGGIGGVLVQMGILLFVAVLVFQLVTLPVEFDASARALKVLETENILNSEELGPAKKVLKAAALTYVAAVAVSLLNLVRLIMIFGGRDDD